jgi:hypothetical protein
MKAKVPPVFVTLHLLKPEFLAASKNQNARRRPWLADDNFEYLCTN